MNRREFAQRLSVGFGVTLTPGTIAAIVSGCRPRDTTFSFLTEREAAIVDSLCEAIIPETDTPGARAAGVVHYVDMLLAEFSDDAERSAFRSRVTEVAAWLADNDAETIGDLDARTRDALLLTLDAYAFPDDYDDTREAGVSSRSRVEGMPDSDQPLFRMLKPWTVAGYYTSEVGATQELRLNPMTPYRDVPLSEVRRTWA